MVTIGAAAGTLGLITASLATAAPAPGRRVTVRPRVGSPTTTFSVNFRAPDRTGKVDGQERYYVVSASGPGGDGSCLGQISRYARASRAHARARVELVPGAGGWCSGRFHGTVTEQARPVCPYREVCPLYVVLVRTVGRFSFTVSPGATRSDTQPPIFAGLKSATTCTPGPERPGERTRYHLTWKTAHDNVTPPAKVVYDVFESATSGGEDFSQPSWTAPPGATTFTTPRLPANGPVYFVVRARDRAGNEDQNDIERAGVNPCL